VCRDQELARTLKRKLVFFAILGEFARPLRTHPCLEGAGRVVDAAMQNAAIATAGVATSSWFFLQNDDALIRVTVLQFAREGQTDDTGADDQEV
jgi:hypothetical protein